MKFDPFLSDEPSLAPPTPGAALVRLSQIAGVLRGDKANANGVPNCESVILKARQNLLNALEAGQNPGSALSEAQSALRGLYAQIAEKNPNFLKNLGFPDAQRSEENWVTPVKIETLVVTHFKPVRQVFSTFSFEEAHGAMAYRLHEIRYLNGERLDDEVVETPAPRFSRVRIPVGKRMFYIESRNTWMSARSADFEIEIPAL